MAVNLSVKNVPESLAESLRRRAKRHHRSLQGELLAILHAVVAAEAPAAPRPRAGRAATARETAAHTTWTPISSAVAPRSESALIIRAAREGRTKTPAQLFDELSAMGTGTPAESAAIIRKSRSTR